MSALTPAELALFGAPTPTSVPASDNWGFDGAPVPAPSPKIGRLNFTDHSIRPDAEVRAERARTVSEFKPGDTVTVPALGPVTLTAELEGTGPTGTRYSLHPTTEAAVIPPDAPKNDANLHPPEKAKRGRKAAGSQEKQSQSESAQVVAPDGMGGKACAIAMPTTPVPSVSSTGPESSKVVYVVEFGAETQALIKALLAKLG